MTVVPTLSRVLTICMQWWYGQDWCLHLHLLTTGEGQDGGSGWHISVHKGFSSATQRTSQASGTIMCIVQERCIQAAMHIIIVSLPVYSKFVGSLYLLLWSDCQVLWYNGSVWQLQECCLTWLYTVLPWYQDIIVDSFIVVYYDVICVKVYRV